MDSPTPPAPLAGKFETSDALQSGIMSALTKKYGDAETAYNHIASDLTPPSEPADATPASPPPAAPPPVAPPAPSTTPEDTPSVPPDVPLGIPSVPKDFDTSPYAREYIMNGSLSAETYTKLQKEQGFSKQVVDTLIAGMEAQAYHTVLGVINEDPMSAKAEYAQMSRWAQGAWTQEQLVAYNEALASTNPATVQMAVNNLKLSHSVANGVAPARQVTPSAAGPATPPQVTTADIKAKMLDARYGKDPDYTREVEQLFA